jgi:hypothetical protein
MIWVLHAWRAILMGRRPALSIEITRECPLSCPGCYTYQAGHLGGGIGVRDLTDFTGDDLVDRVSRSSAANRWSATASSTGFCRSSRQGASTRRS